MKTKFCGFVAIALLAPTIAAAQETPEMPQPVEQHQWLEQLTGEWNCNVQIFMDPESPIESEGTEQVRSVGKFWTVAENKGNFQGQPFTGIQTLGYDPEKQRFVGTWIDSMNHHLWNYEGTLDESGKVLTLTTAGPCPMNPGQTFKFKEVLEIKNPDHKVFTSSMQGEDGQWQTGMIINYYRK